MNSTIASGTTATAVITLPTITNYKQELVKHVGGLEIRDVNGALVNDGTKIVPVNPLNLDDASSTTFKLRVATASGKFYYALVLVDDSGGEAVIEDFAAVNGGLNNVPVAAPVLFTAATNTGYSWTVTPPAGSLITALTDSLTRNPHFKPDVSGEYTVTETLSGKSIVLFAGKWKGVIVGQDANGRPTADSTCLACHNGTIAPDKFATWKDSGHSEILTQNINDTNSHWTITGCGPCHSVGYNSLADNGGFDEAVLATGCTFTNGDPNNWTDMLANFSAAPHTAAQGDVLLGYNAYFVGSGSYRSLHSLITDTCANCHMEQTQPPALLSYNLAGTKHAFAPSLDICKNCHAVNSALGPMLQATIHSTLEVLKQTIEAKIISRNTGTPIALADMTESHGSPAVTVVFDDATTATIGLNDLPGIKIEDPGTDDLAKAVWNFLIIEADGSLGAQSRLHLCRSRRRTARRGRHSESAGSFQDRVIGM